MCYLTLDTESIHEAAMLSLCGPNMKHFNSQTYTVRYLSPPHNYKDSVLS
jgi:hypothetical protein